MSASTDTEPWMSTVIGLQPTQGIATKAKWTQGPDNDQAYLTYSYTCVYETRLNENNQKIVKLINVGHCFR